MEISDSWLTNLFWVFGVCVCVCVCVLFTYIISISVICVSQEETSLIASNQQMNNLQVNTFCKISISLNYSFNHLFNHLIW